MDHQGTFNLENHESNLFKFHLDTFPAYSHVDHVEDVPPVLIQHPQSFYSYFSDSTPNSAQPVSGNFSSPQLKPMNSPFQRKRCKTMAVSKIASEPIPNTADTIEKREEADDDVMSDEDSDSDADSNNESIGSKKRGKYKIYTETEKSTILSFLFKHGIQKTLDIFSNNTHKITKRKLKSWVENQNKVKGVKGRKTNDPNRDQTLYDWCLIFQRENGRAPTRKEATKKALELSEDPSFQASKGWLDKFSRKYEIEFTPLKIIPPKNKKKNGIDSDSNSTVSNSDTSFFDSMSPLMQAIQSAQPQQQGFENRAKQWNLETQGFPPAEGSNEYEQESHKMGSFFSGNNQQTGNFEAVNFETKDSSSPFLEKSQFSNMMTGNFGIFNGLPTNFQSNFNQQFQQNHYQQQSGFQYNMGDNFMQQNDYHNYGQQQHHQQQQQQQQHMEINSFLNFGNNHSNYNYGGEDQMKLENQY